MAGPLTQTYPVTINGQTVDIEATSPDEAARKAYTQFRLDQRGATSVPDAANYMKTLPAPPDAAERIGGVASQIIGAGGGPEPGSDPSQHEWIRRNEMARQGKTLEGQPIGEAAVQGARDVAGDVLRYGSGFVQLPAALTPIGPVAYPAIGGIAETGAQYLQHGKVTDPAAIIWSAAIPAIVRKTAGATYQGTKDLVKRSAASAAIGAGAEAGSELATGQDINPWDIGAAGTVAGLGSAGVQAATPGMYGLLRSQPGASVALQQEGVQEARGIAPKYMPQMPPGSPAARRAGQSVSSQYYDQIANVNPRVPLQNVVNAANKILRNEYELGVVPAGTPTPLVAKKLQDVAEYINAVVTQDQGMVPFKRVRAIQQRIGELTGSASGEEANALRGAYKLLSRGLFEDLENAATTAVPAGQYGTSATRAAGILKKANSAYRREEAVKELSDLIESGVAKGRTDLEASFNPARPLNALDEARRAPLGSDQYAYLRESFTPQELTEIKTALTNLRGLPSLPPPGGEASIGSGRRIGGVVAHGALGGGVTGAGAYAAGVDPTLAASLGLIGTYAGVKANQAYNHIVANALASDAGRRTFLSLLKNNNGILDERSLRVLAQFTRGLVQGKPGVGGEADQSGQ